jgi:hypothetical protein
MADISDELNQKVLHTLHDRGIELTPGELDATRKEAYRKIRENMRARGYDPPDGDLELLEWMRKVLQA